jgi:hypothetical protein
MTIFISSLVIGVVVIEDVTCGDTGDAVGTISDDIGCPIIYEFILFIFLQ